MLIRRYFICFLFLSFVKTSAYDLTIIGQIKVAASLSRISVGLIDCLKSDLSINVISTPGHFDLDDIPHDVKKIINNPDKTPGKVSILTDVIWTTWSTPCNYVPDSKIKIAYSMIESSAIPKQWVQMLNEVFDAVVVPDVFLQKVYEEYGVNIPIFVIPCGMYSEELFLKPLKSTINKPFVYGVSAEFIDRKNYDVLIEAFAKLYGNNPNFKLKMHGRGGDYLPRINNLIKKYNLNNVEVINETLNKKDYADFLSSLDCYVFLSKGEGFSLTPREALALGIPTIVTNNTAQRTICDSGFVRVVPAHKTENAFYDYFNASVGVFYNCAVKDVQNAMTEVYENYEIYLDMAHKGRDWAKQYLFKNLKQQYLTLVKPKKVILSSKNSIENGILKTNSKKLYSKYK